jgi:hypothetical protein
MLAVSVVAGILAIAGAGCGGSTSTLRIVNVDGPGVAVVPWSGGPTISVPCGTSRDVDTTSAPTQPWLVTVRASSTGELPLQRSASGDVEVLVRRGGALIGAPAPSVGPASLGCAAA